MSCIYLKEQKNIEPLIQIRKLLLNCTISNNCNSVGQATPMRHIYTIPGVILHPPPHTTYTIPGGNPTPPPPSQHSSISPLGFPLDNINIDHHFIRYWIVPNRIASFLKFLLYLFYVYPIQYIGSYDMNKSRSCWPRIQLKNKLVNSMRCWCNTNTTGFTMYFD